MLVRLALTVGLLCAGGVVLPAAQSSVPTNSPTLALRVATFDVDATPPVGSMMAYDPVTNHWELGLRARGIVLLGAGEPIYIGPARGHLRRGCHPSRWLDDGL